MSIEHWLAFCAASAVLLAIPGPTILLIISYSLSHGRKVAFAMLAGVTLGDFTAMTASMLGLGALLATSATIFTALKWIGAVYLIYLGVKLWRAPVAASSDVDASEPVSSEKPVRIFAHAYLVTALNPKSIIFFVAFLPQFIDPHSPIARQLVAYEATFLVLAAANATAYALLASLARRQIRKPAVRRAVNRAGGSLMIGAGALAAGWRHST